MRKYAAVDLGADSGRVIVGTVGEIEEVHRFKNGPVRLGIAFIGTFSVSLAKSRGALPPRSWPMGAR